jgi:integrase
MTRCTDLKWQAELAGIERFHPHVLRHTAASRSPLAAPRVD